MVPLTGSMLSFPSGVSPHKVYQPKVEYLLSNEYCNRTCEVGNGWCEVQSKTSLSVDWTAQQKWTLFFKISLVNTDKPVRKVIQKYHVWDKLNEAICYQQILI